MAAEFVDGLKAISSFRELLLVLWWSMALWLTMAAWFQIALWAFGTSPSYSTGLLVTVMVALAVAAPSAPGFIGTYQAGCVIALTVLGSYSREFSIAYSVVTHTLQAVIIVGMGFLVLHLEGLGLKEIRHQSKTEGSGL